MWVKFSVMKIVQILSGLGIAGAISASCYVVNLFWRVYLQNAALKSINRKDVKKVSIGKDKITIEKKK
jgi:hypothetical protein